MNPEDPDKTLNEVLAAIGNKIRKERVSKGYTLEEMDALCDIDPSDFSRIENGKSNLTFKTLVRIAMALNLESIDVFGIRFSLKNDSGD